MIVLKYFTYLYMLYLKLFLCLPLLFIFVYILRNQLQQEARSIVYPMWKPK